MTFRLYHLDFENLEELNAFNALDLEIRQAKILGKLEQEFESGNSCALLDAVEVCLDANIQTPKWVVIGFRAAWAIGWESGSARTLGEAFDINRPKNWRQKRARKDYLTTLIWQSTIRYMRENPGPIDQALFECVADEWNQQANLEDKDSTLYSLKINSTDVQEAYYAISKISKIPVIEPN